MCFTNYEINFEAKGCASKQEVLELVTLMYLKHNCMIVFLNQNSFLVPKIRQIFLGMLLSYQWSGSSFFKSHQ